MSGATKIKKAAARPPRLGKVAVKVTNFPDPQRVKVTNHPDPGKVKVVNFPNSQTVKVGNLPKLQAVKVTNFPASQTVKIADLPDPQNVKVVNPCLPVELCAQAKLVTLFDQVDIPANGNATGPVGGLDLTGCAQYRLVLRLDGTAGAPFTVNELYGPAGSLAQLNSDIATGTLDSLGSLNYRAKFDVFGPKAFFIRVFNNGSTPLKVSGSLYAVK